MGGLPQIVNCQGHAHINPNVEDVANISLTFAGMRFATVQNSWLEPRKVRQITFVGSHGMIVYDDLELREKIRVYDVRVDFPRHYEDFAEFQYSYHYGECRIPHLDQKEPLRILASHFIDCIHRQSRPDSCGARGREVVRVLEACSESLRGQGCPVHL